MFFSIDPVERLVLLYAVCDACAHGALRLVITVVSILAVSMFCCCGVYGVHERFKKVSTRWN
jgi:hypothetical protein